IAEVRCDVGETTMLSSDVIALTESRQRPSRVSIGVHALDLRLSLVDMNTPLSMGNSSSCCRSTLLWPHRRGGGDSRIQRAYKLGGNLYIHALSKARYSW